MEQGTVDGRVSVGVAGDRARLHDYSVDPDGVVWTSIWSMGDAWGVDHFDYFCLMADGWNPSDAVECLSGGDPMRSACAEAAFYADRLSARTGEGMRYASVVGRSAPRVRPDGPARPGQQASLKPLPGACRIVPSLTRVVDPQGRLYGSVTALCLAWSADESMVQRLLGEGRDLADALAIASRGHGASLPAPKGPVGWADDPRCAYVRGFLYASSQGRPLFVDHCGNAWPSREAMCRAWLVDDELFGRRVLHGWPLSLALTDRSSDDGPRDGSLLVSGRLVGDVRNRCLAKGVQPVTFLSRVSKGVPVCVAADPSMDLRRYFSRGYDRAS